MCHIITIANQKGGVGKTTSAVNLAAGLLHMGKATRVALLDLDPQGGAGRHLGVPKPDHDYTFVTNCMARFSGDWGKELAVPIEAEPGLTVISEGEPTGMILDLIQKNQALFWLRHCLIPLREHYDYIILDLPPASRWAQKAAFLASDACLIPTRLDTLAILAAKDTLAHLETLKDQGHKTPELLGILPTFWEMTTNETIRQLESLYEAYGDLVWAPIPKDVKAREAPGHGQSLWTYAPTCRAVQGNQVWVAGYQVPVGGYKHTVSSVVSRTT